MKFTNKDQLITDLYVAAQTAGYIANARKELPDAKTPQRLVKYLTACVDHCETQMNKIMFDIPMTRLRKIGRYNIPGQKGKKEYIWYFGQRHLKFFDIAEVGNSGSNAPSTGSITNMYKDILMKYEQTEAPVQQVEVAASILGESKVEVPVKLNRARIEDAIKLGFYYDGINSRGEKKIVKIDKINETSQLKYFLKNMDANDTLYQTFTQKSTGRLYSEQGTHTLLSVSKVVRNIATPRRTILDINSACFSVFLKIYNQMQKDEGFYHPLHYIEQYVSEPKKARLKIVKDICSRHYEDDSGVRPPPVINSPTTTEYKMVKEAFTAMGFGAKTTDPSKTGYNKSYWKTSGGTWKTDALTGILKHRADYFMTNDFVIGFIKDLQMLNEMILYKYELKEGETEHDIYTNVKIDRSRSKPQQLALIYQSIERQMLDHMYGAIPKDNVMALIHDGIMIQTPSDKRYAEIAVTDAINKNLVILLPNGDHMQLTGGQDIKVTSEHIDIDTLNESASAFSDAELIERDHKEHISEEKHIAAITDYVPQSTVSFNQDPNFDANTSLRTVKKQLMKTKVPAPVQEVITVATMLAMCHTAKKNSKGVWGK